MILRRVPYLLLVAVLCSDAAQGQNAQAVFERFVGTYESVQRLRADFTYTVSSEILGEVQAISGFVVAERDRYRIDTGSELLVVNPEGTSVFRRSEAQVLLSNSDEAPGAIVPGMFLIDFDEMFEPTGMETTSVGGVRHHALALRSIRRDVPFVDVTVWVRQSDGIVTRLLAVDKNETHTDISLLCVEIDPPVAPNTFVFTPPLGVEIIDLRS